MTAQRVLVVGLARTGESVASRLLEEGAAVTVVEERPGADGYAARRDTVSALGGLVVEQPGAEAWTGLVAGADLVVPSPGVPEWHPVLAAARAAGVPVCSEIEIAAARITAPIVAVTGTNGKTTVTEMVTAMLGASGRRARSAGNIGRPLLDLAGASPDSGVDVVVAEVSSFQLAFTDRFRPRVAVLLPVAEDHTDWHGSFEAYSASKARVFANQRDDDLLVYDEDDGVARRLAERAPAGRVGFSLRVDGSGFRLAGDALVDPCGAVLALVEDLPRRLPHDLANALASSAAALAVGATRDGVLHALRSFTGLPHRVALVRDAGGVCWYDDSKATNPHAVLRAIAAFDRVVLLAGGRNKGLDLRALARGANHVRAVVAFGEAAPEVEEAFAGCRPVVRAATMREAVRAAAARAHPGDVVLLSPGCASFDAYADYAARGDDFAAEVQALTGPCGGGEESW